MMTMLIDCSVCRTPLELPPATRSIRCAICGAVTLVAEPRSFPPPPPPQPQPMMPWGPAPWPAYGGRKKAVICGISYRGRRYELQGCLNDAKCMRHLLLHRFDFREHNILMLTEEEVDQYRIPTRRNIMMAMYWLIQGCQPGDSLVFHYSGHGSQKRNLTGEEADGYDETLCPLDYETQGMIIDDEINLALVRPLPPGVKLHAIMDCCHSGTVLDLPYLCRMDRSGLYRWEDHRPRTGAWKGSSGGEVICFSGCDDDQTSADTSALSRVTSTGALTFCFIQAIEQGHGATYGSMLNSIRGTMRNTNLVEGSVATALIAMLLTGGRPQFGLSQEPQLTSTEMFDVYAKPFSM